MRKKQMIKKIAIILIVVGIVAYFFPMRLSSHMGEQKVYNLSIMHNELEAPFHTTTDNYDELDSEQIEALNALADDYFYMRTFRTCFANSIKDIGATEFVLTVWTVDDDSYSAEMLVISSSGNVLIDGHPYRLLKAEEFTERAVDIFSE